NGHFGQGSSSRRKRGHRADAREGDVVPARDDGRVPDRARGRGPSSGGELPGDSVSPGPVAFGAATRDWFDAAFAAPTPAQAQAWSAISAGKHALVVAPTGSGKTLAAFLWSIDRLAAEGPPADPTKRCRVLYVSPLKALAVDVERNLRTPLVGIKHA